MKRDDGLELSRRKALATIGGIGVASAGSGLATSAYFNDEERFEENSITAGTLDLGVTWQQLYYGGPQSSRPGDYGDAERPFVNAHPDGNGNGIQSFGDDAYVDPDDYDDPEDAATAGTNLAFSCEDISTFGEPTFAPNERALIELDDAKPGDCGEVTFGITLCDNPGYVWLTGDLVGESDGGHPESDGPQLADEILVRAWYDLDGDNVEDEDEPRVVAGTLRDVLEELRTGRSLAFDPTRDVVDGSDDEDGADGGDSCIRLPKVEGDAAEDLAEGDVFTYEVDGEQITITIANVYFEDGDPIGFDWESTVGVCGVRVKGGNPDGPGRPEEPGEGPATVFDGCPTEGTVFAPKNERNSNRTYYGISNFRFYVCDPETDGGEGDGSPECFEPSRTRYVGFEWCLPLSVGNHVQGDAVEFDLGFYGEQCRHNDDPDGPRSHR